MTEFTLPIVDISAFLDGAPDAKKKVASDFADAFESVGFAVITGHGIPETLTGGLYDAALDFFDEPFDTKMTYSPPEVAKSRGYLPMGMESVAKTLNGETPPDLCEALVFGAPHHEGEDGHVANYYPKTPVAFTELVTEYTHSILDLNAVLMRLSALALDLPEDYFAPMYADPSLTLRFVNYPDQDTDPLPGQLRYGEHHDYGAITILRQDMVAFTGPSADTMVSALPSCVSDEAPAKYDPVQAGEYIMSKIRASHDLDNK